LKAGCLFTLALSGILVNTLVASLNVFRDVTPEKYPYLVRTETQKIVNGPVVADINCC
jgi:hypothetical protein